MNLFELEEELAKRPRMREKLEALAEGGELSAWEIDPVHNGGKRPLLLMVRVRSRSGREQYYLVSGQAGKGGAVYQWEHFPDAYGSKRGKHPGGRPVTFGQEHAAEAKRLRGEGKSFRQIAEELGASTHTVRRLLGVIK